MSTPDFAADISRSQVRPEFDVRQPRKRNNVILKLMEVGPVVWIR